jgi:hypothetical protein
LPVVGNVDTMDRQVVKHGTPIRPLAACMAT